MNYYPFHIGDFRSGTVNMTRQARWIYRDMLDVYYDTEKPLALDFDALCDEIGVEKEAERSIVARLLRFKFIKGDHGYSHAICERVIADYHVKAETAKTNGKLGGRPKKAKANPKEPTGFQSGSDQVASGVANGTGSEANQEPITKNHKPKPKNNDNTGVVAPPEELPEPVEPASHHVVPLPMRENPPVSLDPAVIISVALRRQGVTANSCHPAVQDWATKGVSIDLLTEAVSLAREAKGDETIPPNYLIPIVAKLLNPPAMAGPKPRAPPPPDPRFFGLANVDRTSDQLAMDESMKRRGVVVADGDDLSFDLPGRKK